MAALLKEWLGAIVRWALTLAAGYLVAGGAFTPEQADGLVDSTTPYLVAALVPLVWSLIAKWWARLKLRTALDMPSGSSEAAVKMRIDSGRGAKVLTILLAVSLVASAAAACGASLRQRVIVSYQATEISLGAVQDAEMALFRAGTVPALTLDHHVAISEVFARAFDAQVRFGRALLEWRPSAIPPTGYAQWVTSIEDTLVALDAILPSQSAPALRDATLAWARAAVGTIRTLGQAPAANIAALVR